MRPATVSHRETLLEKMSLEHNRLGTDESLHSRVFQKQDAAGDAIHDCDSRGPSKDTGSCREDPLQMQRTRESVQTRIATLFDICGFTLE